MNLFLIFLKFYFFSILTYFSLFFCRLGNSLEDSTLDPRSSLSPKILKAPRAVLGAVFSDSMELSKAFHAIRYMLGERKREREKEREREER